MIVRLLDFMYHVMAVVRLYDGCDYEYGCISYCGDHRHHHHNMLLLLMMMCPQRHYYYDNPNNRNAALLQSYGSFSLLTQNSRIICHHHAFVFAA